MANTERWDRTAAVAVACVVEVGLVAWLSAYRADAVPDVASDDDALTIEFIQRPLARRLSRSAHAAGRTGLTQPQRSPETRRRHSAPPLAGLGGTVDAGKHPDDNPQAPSATATLDLTVPAAESVAGRRFAPQAERQAALATVPTRFERSWRSDGTALEQLKRRSKVAGFALSIFGGPSRHCDEVAGACENRAVYLKTRTA